MADKYRILKPQLEDIPALTELVTAQDQLHHDLDPLWYALPSPVTVKKIQKELETVIRKGKVHMLIAKARNRIIAFCTFSVVRDDYHNAIHRKFGEIFEVFVSDESRGLGAGGALIKAAEDYFISLGLHSVMIRCSSKNMPAQEFYAHLGYHDTTTTLSKELTA